MIVSFGSRRLRELCSYLHEAYRWLGITHGQALIRLISDIEALQNADELLKYFGPAASPITERDMIIIEIGTKYKGEFLALGAKIRRDADERIEWSSVHRVKLIEISRVSPS